MKKVIYILFIFPFVLLGQNLDSLKLALKNAAHDTTRCNILTLIIDGEGDDNVWPKYNEELGLIAKKNLATSENLKNVYLKHPMLSLNNIGYLANSQGDITRPLKFFRQSLFFKIIG